MWVFTLAGCLLLMPGDEFAPSTVDSDISSDILINILSLESHGPLFGGSKWVLLWPWGTISVCPVSYY
jgi:hypothetical protein